MTAEALTTVDLTAPDEAPQLLRAAFDAVLRPSFTGDELGGPETIEPSERRVVSIVSTAAGEPMGVAVTDLDPDGISLLANLAVSPASRGLGVGARLMDHLAEVWAARAGVVLAEVHDPRGHADTPSEHPLARLRFYERAGARVLDTPFVQPALHPGAARVPDMLLLVLHPVGPAGAVDAVDSAELAEWIRRYYVAVEGTDPTDPTARRLLARVRERESVPAWPLARWRDVARLTLDG